VLFIGNSCCSGLITAEAFVEPTEVEGLPMREEADDAIIENSRAVWEQCRWLHRRFFIKFDANR